MPRAVNEQSGEHILVVPDLFPKSSGKIRRTVRFPSLIPYQHHQLFRMGDRQRLEHHDIDQRENSRVSTDTERERQNSDCGEARVSPQVSDA